MTIEGGTGGGAAPSGGEGGSTPASGTPDAESYDGVTSGYEEAPAETPPETPPPDAAAKPPETPPAPKKYKVKWPGADGKSTEREVDEQELVRNYQLARLSQERLQQAAAQRKRVEQWAQQVEQDPLGYLEQKLGPEVVRRWAEERVSRLVQEQQMTPEQKARMEIDMERQRLAQEQQAWHQKQQQARQQEEVRQIRARFENDFPGALKATGLEPNERNMRRMVAIGLQHIDAGIPLDAAGVAAEVRAEHDEHVNGARGLVRERLKGAGEKILDALKEEWGPDFEAIANAFRAADLRRVRPGSPPGVAPPKAAEAPPQNGRDPATGQFTQKFISPDQFRREMEAERAKRGF